MLIHIDFQYEPLIICVTPVFFLSGCMTPRAHACVYQHGSPGWGALMLGEMHVKT